MSALDQVFTLALGAHDRGDLSQAELLCRQILRVDARHIYALQLLAVTAARLGRPAEGCEHLRQALQINPDFREGRGNLGNILLGMGELEEAIACYRAILRVQPEHLAAWNNLGVALLKARHFEEAAASCRQALRLQPDLVDALTNLGGALLELGRLEDAREHLLRALQLQPGHAEAHNSLGVVLDRMGKVEEALASFETALAEAPEHFWAHFNHAVDLLLTGKLAQGWPEYEWRRRLPQYTVSPLPGKQPPWDGSPLQGRTILLRAEQGLGDTIQFIRYARLLKQQGGRVIAEVQTRLLSLLRRLPELDQVVGRGEALPSFDVHAELLSLPGLLGTELGNIPAPIPYLSPDPDRVARWSEELKPFPGFKVGIGWKGNPEHLMDAYRSAPLAAFAPLAEAPGVHLLSLQTGPAAGEIAALGGRFPVADLGSRFDPASLEDAAAVIRNLDLVVTVDTALAHLAGAMEVPVWLALAFRPDWRWLLDCSDSPWYPGIRLFRQTRLGVWDDVFEEIQAALRERIIRTR